MVRLGVERFGEPERTFLISIPVWFDWEDKLPSDFDSYLKISIPVWFDWECLKGNS